MSEVDERSSWTLRATVETEAHESALTALERQRLDFTLSHLPADVESALEIGFGDFRMTRRLCERVATTALDLPRPLSIPPPGADLAFGSIEALPFADGQFDIAVCCEVLEHLPQSTFEAAVRELQRVARRYLLITVPYKQRVWNERYKCPSCGITWHYSDHCRMFDESLASRFGAWTAKTRTFGVTKGYAPDLVYRIANLAGNAWSESPWGCHVCKAASTEQKPNMLGFVLQRILWRWEARVRRRPIWMLMVLTRTES